MGGSGAGSRRGANRQNDQPAGGTIRGSTVTQGEPEAAARAGAIDHQRAFVVLRAAQRALLRAEDEAELLRSICRIAVEEAGYRLAWVGLAEDGEERPVRPVAQAGYEEGYLESVTISWADTPLGRGPTGTAIRTGRPVVGRNFLTDPELAPWRDHAIERGFLSSVALPLQAHDRTFGALTIYAAEPDAFSPQDVDLLTGLADDLSFGIMTLRSRNAAYEALRRSEHNLAEAQRIAHIGSWEWNLETGAALRSDELYRIYGVEPGAIAETTEAFLAFVHPGDLTRVQASERAAATGNSDHDLDYRIITADGAVRTVHEQGEVTRDEHGRPVRLIGTVEDITERVAADAERFRLALAVEQTADAVWMQNADGTVTFVNRAFSRMYGYEPGEIVGRTAGIVDSGRQERAAFDEIWTSVASGKTWSGLIVNRRKDGTLIEVEAVISAIRDDAGRLLSYMQTDRDVTRERELEGVLERVARERTAIEAALAQINPADTPEVIAATACDEIVQLPAVDSAWAIGIGPAHGRVLGVAGRVARTLVVGDLVPSARAGQLRERAATGPWFETWQVRPEDGDYGVAISAAGVHSEICAPLTGQSGVIGVIVLGTHDPEDAGRILEHLPALATFGSVIGALLAPGIATRHREDDARASVQAILNRAAFTPFFQPIVELRTGAVVGYEALSRFGDGTPPDVAFRTAHLAGLGIELETATIATALGAAAILPPGAYLSLNASPALVRSDALGVLLVGCEREIVLEITEHIVIDDYPALRRELTALGPNVRLAVDDAGAGYASLRHILELAPDFVKLDIGLIGGIDADPARQALIAGMGYFAVKRKVRLIAEGIETKAELKALQKLGVGYGQGYLLGRPQDGRVPGPWPKMITLGRR